MKIIHPWVSENFSGSKMWPEISHIKANYGRWSAIWVGKISNIPKGTSTSPEGCVCAKVKKSIHRFLSSPKTKYGQMDGETNGRAGQFYMEGDEKKTILWYRHITHTAIGNFRSVIFQFSANRNSCLNEKTVTLFTPHTLNTASWLYFHLIFDNPGGIIICSAVPRRGTLASSLQQRHYMIIDNDKLSARITFRVLSEKIDNMNIENMTNLAPGYPSEYLLVKRDITWL